MIWKERETQKKKKKPILYLKHLRKTRKIPKAYKNNNKKKELFLPIIISNDYLCNQIYRAFLI